MCHHFLSYIVNNLNLYNYYKLPLIIILDDELYKFTKSLNVDKSREISNCFFILFNNTINTYEYVQCVNCTHY